MSLCEELVRSLLMISMLNEQQRCPSDNLSSKVTSFGLEISHS